MLFSYVVSQECGSRLVPKLRSHLPGSWEGILQDTVGANYSLAL
jgi:hypothetical protein